MPAMTECILNGRTIDVLEAIDIRDTEGRAASDFRCTECKEPVRPHRAGGNAAAHFEHLERNPDCSQSHCVRQLHPGTKAAAFGIIR